MAAPRLQVSDKLRAMMAYPKFAGSAPRVLVLESQYWLDAALLRAADRLGWETAKAPVRMHGQMPREMVAQFLEAVTSFRPDFVFTVNLSGMDEAGLFAGLFDDLAIPYLSWFVDDPRTILMGRSCYGSEYAVGLSWDAAYESYLSSCGFATVSTLPLAVDSELFNASPIDAPPLPPTFIANSMVQFATEERDWLKQYPELLAAIDCALTEGVVTRENFGIGLDAMLPPERAATLDEHQYRHAEMYCFIEGTRRLRTDLVRALAPQGLHVRGDDAWAQVTEDRGPYVNYEQDLPNYYRDCVVNLNSTSIQMPHAVNQRVFDCPMAGGFLLTDAQSSLENLFDPATEIATYHDSDEAQEKMAFYRNNPAARSRIVTAARKRILAEHTYAHRLASIEHLLRERFRG